jgi:hypothetical protein
VVRIAGFVGLDLMLPGGRALESTPANGAGSTFGRRASFRSRRRKFVRNESHDRQIVDDQLVTFL